MLLSQIKDLREDLYALAADRELLDHVNAYELIDMANILADELAGVQVAMERAIEDQVQDSIDMAVIAAAEARR